AGPAARRRRPLARGRGSAGGRGVPEGDRPVRPGGRADRGGDRPRVRRHPRDPPRDRGGPRRALAEDRVLLLLLRGPDHSGVAPSRPAAVPPEEGGPQARGAGRDGGDPTAGRQAHGSAPLRLRHALGPERARARARARGPSFEHGREPPRGRSSRAGGAGAKRGARGGGRRRGARPPCRAGGPRPRARRGRRAAHVTLATRASVRTRPLRTPAAARMPRTRHPALDPRKRPPFDRGRRRGLPPIIPGFPQDRRLLHQQSEEGTSMYLAAEGGPIKAVFGSFEDRALWIILGISLIALLFAYYLVREVLAAPQGTDKMKEIARAIQEGASAYLRRQFTTVGVFLVILTVAIFFLLPVPEGAVHGDLFIRFGRSIAFILGAGFSGITGFTGMWLAVRANVRVADAARESGLRRAMRLAFRAGGVAGMFTVGLGLLGATVILIVYKTDATDVLVGFGFGGALLAMFMRVGGGIFTKAADVGADLVGKVEKGIPEDDPRNAAVIADNVGDNVGD